MTAFFSSLMRREALWTSAAVFAVAASLAWATSPADSATPDSTNYLNAALHLASGNGYVTSAVEWGHAGSNGPITVFAPGFPWLAAMLIKLGLSPRAALSALVGASFALYALATWWIMRLALPSRLRSWAVVATAVLIIQPAVREALDMALSDLFGAALALCCAALLLRSEHPTRNESQLIGILLGVGIVGRWANLYLAVAAGIALLCFAWPQFTLRQRIARMLHVGIPALLIVAPLWLHNFWITGTLMGDRPVEVKDPIAQLGAALVGVAHWFVTAHRELEALPWLATLHGALALALGFFLVSSPLTSGDYRARVGFTLAAGYVVAMVLSSSIVHYDPLTGTRFWLLVTPLITASGIRVLCAAPHPRWLKHAVAGTWLTLGTHAAGLAAIPFWHELEAPRTPSGYFGEPFATSPILAQAIAMHDTQRCVLASNEEFALLPKIGTRPLRMVRSKDAPGLAGYDGQPLCLVIVHDADEKDVRPHVLRLAKQGRMQFEGADEAAELWLFSSAEQQARLE